MLVDRPVQDDGAGLQLGEEVGELRNGFTPRVGFAVDLLEPVERRAEGGADGLLLGRPRAPRPAAEVLLLAAASLAVGVVDNVHVE